MERKIPDKLNHVLVRCKTSLIKKESNTIEDYLKAIESFELDWQERLIHLLSNVGIYATTKMDRFSLPYNEEINLTLRGSSWLNDAFDFTKLGRLVVKRLLEEDFEKVRFYLLIEIDTSSKNFLEAFGRVHYKFRYYKPK